jgi:ring-1,2-phenylacetyl-CoA epoxidase subunit PaaC
LGDGTPESNQRMNDALEFLWMYVGEMFEVDEITSELIKEGIAVDVRLFKNEWLELVNSILTESTLPKQSFDAFMQTGGRKGRHTEYMGHILAEMQYIPRAYPNSQW